MDQTAVTDGFAPSPPAPSPAPPSPPAPVSSLAPSFAPSRRNPSVAGPPAVERAIPYGETPARRQSR
jgi:hypothetical protein